MNYLQLFVIPAFDVLFIHLCTLNFLIFNLHIYIYVHITNKYAYTHVDP